MKFKTYFLYFCIALMVLFAYFQWNDPDPHIWIPLYLFVAYMGYRKLKFNDAKIVFFGPAFLYFLWGLSLYPEIWEGVMLNEMGMKTMNIELGRESWGLFINTSLLVIFAFLPNEK
ncbi:transmembrane 220 family protein [Marinilongibacter aquaticus]|uniref:transmembrane 220 family protein n=1 Tax=Marinilongibacter aquaticus TaxID=2975157 RepID=UPI0021BD3968|nr:transmembrane 220 family protein [Marinilongibacter aquaticus]UBM59331.1 transmembrane 220 family protein [Marinilongibacter aquaticus]